ncbi:energy transducer TonB [Sphingopyxis flava]|uniref:Outer membrane transport energization protein TonB n=1 Tax=Sphingopyxis flava TaxID=1507287 RepID=A0A1T5CC84_9SPHN|nr:energy transducer TonB [Sphingopyxis flava]SKB57068.1 outer membrane transport energization protein TonB [Sphingopyxis flava]
MLSSNSLAFTTTSSGTGPRPDALELPQSGETGRPNLARPSARAASGRYGEDRKLNLPAAALSLMVAAAVLAALLQTNYRRAQTEAARLAVINLSAALPPPPPAAPRDVPEQQQAPVAAPRPLTPIPVERSPLLAVPDPSPPPPVPVALAPAPAAPPAPPAPPATVEADDLSAHMLSSTPPSYPRESRRQREEGTVLLALTLDVDGSVAAISVAQSSGFRRLDEAALRAVRKWRWAPTIRRGQAVMVKGLVEIPFILRAK